MNHLKQVAKLDALTAFLTYADNYAIGYFRKQVGREIWARQHERGRASPPLPFPMA